MILEKRNDATRVISEETSYVMNRLMQLVVQSRNGTGADIWGSWTGGWQVFGKTGTSGTSRSGSDYNVYFAGGTTEYVAASWFGYDYDKALDRTQTGYARSLWNKVMVALRDDSLSSRDKGFDAVRDDLIARDKLVEATYCTATGMLVGEHNNCPETEVGVYKTSFMPGECTEHLKDGATLPSTPGDEGGSTTGTTAPNSKAFS